MVGEQVVERPAVVLGDPYIAGVAPYEGEIVLLDDAIVHLVLGADEDPRHTGDRRVDEFPVPVIHVARRDAVAIVRDRSRSMAARESALSSAM